MTTERPELLTRQEAADRLRVSITTVTRLYRAGELPHVRIGKQVRIPDAALTRYLEGEVTTQPATPLAADDESTWPPTPSMLAEQDDHA